ncbi:PH domain-containing protein [Janibacter melonis]|uniref:PH domain-containing protein n=1 Tax=Janibacter melonis TaxID=262209 RepID=UPI0020964F9B|nr:PH domain-containing protein [Janibacter melonis]
MEEVAHRGLRRYLLPGETPVAEIRHHAIVLLKPALAVVGATAVAGWLDVSTSDSGSRVLSFVWLVWLAVVLWALWQWVEWRHTRVVATDKRVVLFEGWINHKVSMMPLKKVTDMGYERSLVGRLLGYGTFILESAGQDQALSRIAFVPDPDENYRAICSVVFGVVPGEEDEDEGAATAPGRPRRTTRPASASSTAATSAPPRTRRRTTSRSTAAPTSCVAPATTTPASCPVRPDAY